MFVSYAHQDGAAAERLVLGLRTWGLSAWFDRSHILPGQLWLDAIARGARGARAAIVVIGRRGLAGVQAEEARLFLNHAAAHPDFRIVPVLLPGAATSDELTDFLRLRSWVEVDHTIDDDLIEKIAVVSLGVGAGDEPTDPSTFPNPYPGLAPFGERIGAELFFGRDADIARAVERLGYSASLAVVGPSGVGKSSFARAGLLPALLPSFGGRDWCPIIVKPGNAPLNALAARLAAEGSHEYYERLEAEPQLARLAMEVWLSRKSESTGLLLLVDQLEEVFTQCTDAVRRPYLDALEAVADLDADRVRVVVTMRSDFLDPLQEYAAFAGRVAAHALVLGPLTASGLADAIRLPAWKCGRRFEGDLVERIVDDCAGLANATPLLAAALESTWDHARGRIITLSAYRASGGVAESLPRRADDAIAPFAGDDQVVPRRVLLSMVHVVAGGGAARLRPTIDAVGERSGDPPAATRLIRALADARIVTTQDPDAEQALHREVERGPAGEGATVELVHDVLLTAWPRLADWIGAYRERQLDRQRLSDNTTRWIDSGRSPSFLASEGDLAVAEGLVAEGFDHATASESEFVAASRAAADQRVVADRVSRTRRHRLVVAAGTIGALVLLGGFLALQYRASSRTLTAQRPLRLAADALGALGSAPDTGLLLAAEAFARDDSLTTRSALLSALATDPQPLGYRRVVDSSVIADRVATPEGDLVVTIGDDGRVSFCPVTGGPCSEWATTVPNAQDISTANGNIVVLDAAGALSVGTQQGVTITPQPLDAVAVDALPSGLLAVGTADGGVLVANPSNLANPQVLGTLNDDAAVVAASDDGRWVAAAGGAGSDVSGVHVYSTDVAPFEVVIAEPLGRVTSLAFTADGRYLLAGDIDSLDVVAYETDSFEAGVEPQPAGRLSGHTAAIDRLLVDGETLLSSDRSGEVRVWDLANLSAAGTAYRSMPPLGSTRPSGRLSASWLTRDGDALAMLRGDGTIIEFDLVGRSALGRESAASAPDVRAAARAPDGGLLVARGGAATLFDADGTPRWQVAVEGGPVAAASRDGSLVALGTSAGPLLVLDAATGATVDSIPVAASALAFDDDGALVIGTADGRLLRRGAGDAPGTTSELGAGGGPIARLATAGPTGPIALVREGATEVEIVDPAGGPVIRLQPAEEGQGASTLAAVAFSSDGGLLAVGSDDRSASVWHVDGWTPVARMVGHIDMVTALEFVEDDTMLVTGSQDGTIRLWRADDGTPVGPPHRWGGAPIERLSATSTPDGEVVVSLDQLGNVVEWPATPDAWLDRACEIAGRTLTPAEHARYLDWSDAPPACAAAG